MLSTVSKDRIQEAIIRGAAIGWHLTPKEAEKEIQSAVTQFRGDLAKDGILLQNTDDEVLTILELSKTLFEEAFERYGTF